MTNEMPNGRGPAAQYWASIRERTRKDGSVSYTVLCRLDGRQFPVTFRDQKQAAAFQALVKAHGVTRALEMNGVAPPARREKSLTVSEWIDQHIDSLSGVERKTVAEYRRYLTRDIAPTLGGGAQPNTPPQLSSPAQYQTSGGIGGNIAGLLTNLPRFLSDLSTREWAPHLASAMRPAADPQRPPATLGRPVPRSSSTNTTRV